LENTIVNHREFIAGIKTSVIFRTDRISYKTAVGDDKIRGIVKVKRRSYIIV
jgi:hypothetical protein